MLHSTTRAPLVLNVLLENNGEFGLTPANRTPLASVHIMPFFQPCLFIGSSTEKFIFG
jgi:hypothetical protein